MTSVFVVMGQGTRLSWLEYLPYRPLGQTMAISVRVISRDATCKVPFAEGGRSGRAGPWNVLWPSNYSWSSCNSEWAQTLDMIGHARHAYIEVLPLLAQMSRNRRPYPTGCPRPSGPPWRAKAEGAGALDGHSQPLGLALHALGTASPFRLVILRQRRGRSWDKSLDFSSLIRWRLEWLLEH